MPAEGVDHQRNVRAYTVYIYVLLTYTVYTYSIYIYTKSKAHGTYSTYSMTTSPPDLNWPHVCIYRPCSSCRYSAAAHHQSTEATTTASDTPAMTQQQIQEMESYDKMVFTTMGQLSGEASFSPILDTTTSPRIDWISVMHTCALQSTTCWLAMSTWPRIYWRKQRRMPWKSLEKTPLSMVELYAL